MGGRYGGQIKNRGRGSGWSTRKAIEQIGREAFHPFQGIGKATRRLAPRHPPMTSTGAPE